MLAIGDRKVALAISAHTDDSELGAGGTLTRMVEEGWTIHCLALCDLLWSKLKVEFECAMAVLGVPQERLDIGRFPNRFFPGCRQAVLEWIEGALVAIEPAVVFVPSLCDSHQDHNVVTQEAMRITVGRTVFGYEQPWKSTGAASGALAFVALSKSQMEKKVEALACYETQQHRAYFQEDIVWSLAKIRGLQAGVEFAEAFQVLRMVL